MKVIVKSINDAHDKGDKDLAFRLADAFLTDLQNATPHPDSVDFHANPEKIDIIHNNCQRCNKFIKALPTGVIVELMGTPAWEFFSYATQEAKFAADKHPGFYQPKADVEIPR